MSRLINDDCMNVLPTMADDSVQMVLTDIPYDFVNMESGGLRELDRGVADVMTVSLATLVPQLTRVCSGSLYVFCGPTQVSELLSLFKGEGLSVRMGIWEKSNPSPMNGEYLWLSAIECCVFARKPKATFHEHCKSSVWRDRSLPDPEVHPTMKPLSLFTYLLKASSNPGDIVLDPFMGSGTTGVACHESLREFIGVELDPTYFKRAVERIHKEEQQLRMY